MISRKAIPVFSCLWRKAIGWLWVQGRTYMTIMRLYPQLQSFCHRKVSRRLEVLRSCSNSPWIKLNRGFRLQMQVVSTIPALPVMDGTGIEQVIRELVVSYVGNDVARDVPLVTQGLDFLTAMELRQKLQVSLISPLLPTSLKTFEGLW